MFINPGKFRFWVLVNKIRTFFFYLNSFFWCDCSYLCLYLVENELCISCLIFLVTLIFQENKKIKKEKKKTFAFCALEMEIWCAKRTWNWKFGLLSCELWFDCINAYCFAILVLRIVFFLYKNVCKISILR